MQNSQYIFMVTYLLFNTLAANDVVNNVKQASDILSNDDGNVYSIPENCTDILDEFAQCAAKFTSCSITNARPIKLCENCVNEYVSFTGKYQQLLKTVVNGTSCHSYFISQDRFDVILEYYGHIMTVWNKGHCNDCFEFSEGVPKLSNNTINFNKMAKDTMDCINLKRKTENGTDEVCVRCMQLYLDLNNFYGTLSKDSIGVDSVCMDIVDSMNHTRSKWSKDLNCCKMRKSPEIIFLCCTSIISLLPLLYYIVVRFYGPIKDLPNVLRESRFKQSLLRSMQVRVN